MDVIQKKINQFFATYNEQSFLKGELLFKPEDAIQTIYYLEEGIVRMYAISKDGEEITFTLFRKNSFIPIMLVLGQGENAYYFEAVENCKTRKAPVSEVVVFLKHNSDVLFDVTERFAKAICGLVLRIEDLATASSDKKIINLLVYLSEKFGEANDTGTHITIPITHENIANWVGIRRETVSRFLAKLQKEGIILSNKRHFAVTDFKRLQQYSSSL